MDFSTEGLVALWQFDNGLNGAVGGPLTPTGSTSFVSGVDGFAVKMEAGARLESLLPSLPEFTLMARVMRSDGADVAAGAYDGDGCIFAVKASTYPEVAGDLPFGGPSWSHETPCPDDKWLTLLLRYDGEKYTSDCMGDRQTQSHPFEARPGSFSIEAVAGDVAVDCVAVWGRCLSDAEIASLYQEGA